MPETGPTPDTTDKTVDQRESQKRSEAKEHTETVITPEAVARTDAKSHELVESYEQLHAEASAKSPDATKAAGLPPPSEVKAQIPQVGGADKVKKTLKLDVPGISGAVADAITTDNRQEDPLKARMQAAGILKLTTTASGEYRDRLQDMLDRDTKTKTVSVPLPINKLLPPGLQ